MEVSLSIPDEIAKQLNAAGELSRLALEGLAVEGYRHEVLSLGEVAELLAISVYEADGFLKSHGVPAGTTLDELQQQTAALDALLSR
jgi:predicted HTH domain antitoxin